MVYKTCPIERIMAQVYRDFKPSNSGWVEDAVEWIADAVEIIGSYQSYSEQSIELKSSDYRIKIPCQAEMILGVSYKGHKLMRNGGLMHKFYPKNSCLASMPTSNYTYSLNPNYLHTPFKEDCFIVYYLGYELDCNGYPYIIDEAIYRKAITWYVIMMMLGRGFKHQTFTYKDAMNMWETTYPKAQNKCKQPDADSMETFKKNWLGLARSVNREKVYFNTDNMVYENDAHKPGDLLQTFQILGPNANNI